MKKVYSTRKKTTRLSPVLVQLLLMICLGVVSADAFSQRTYATVTPSSGRNAGVKLIGGLIGSFGATTNDGIAKVTSPENAMVGTDAQFATLKVDNLNLLLIEYYGQSWLQMKFPTALPAGKTSFIRIDAPVKGGVSLATLDLLNLLGDAVKVEAYSGATADLPGGIVPQQQVSSTIIKDLSGKYYIAVTSNQSYNSVRVYLTLSSGLLGLALGSTSTMNVYNAFTEGAFPADCGTPWATDEGDVTGVNLNLGVLKGLGISLGDVVTDPTNAIDNNLNSASVISPGALTVAGTASQTIFFNGVSGSSTDAVRFLLSVPASILQLNLGNNVTMQAYNGNTPVGEARSLKSILLNLDLLGLFANNAKVPVYYSPGGQFDRVKINFAALVGAGGSILGGGLSLYDVLRVPAKPVVQNLVNDTIRVCLGSSPTLTVDAIAGQFYKWYRTETGGAIITTAPSYTPPVADLPAGNHVYYVGTSRTGCTSESERTKIVIVVSPQATAADITAANQTICENTAAILTPTTAIASSVFTWYKDNAKTQLITNGLVEGAVTYQIAANGALTVTGLPAGGTTNYFVSVSGTGKCENLAGTLKQVSVTVNAAPVVPAVTASATTVSNGQTAVLTVSNTVPNVTYKWYTVPTGGTSVFTGNPYVTEPLTANTTFYVEAVAASGCVSLTRGQVSITVTPAPMPNPVPCEAAVNDLQTGVGGVLAIGAGVSNSGLAVDNNTLTGSTLTMPVGVLANVYQRIGFNGSSVIGDTIAIKLTSAGKLLSLSLLPSVTVTSYNNAVSNNDEKAVTSPLLHLELLSGGTEAIIKFVPTAVFNGVLVKLNSGAVGALTAINLNYAQRIIATPTVQLASPAVCIGQPAMLSVQNPKAGTIYKWYNKDGVYIVDGNSYTVSSVTAATDYYVEATRNGCASARAKIALTPAAAPVKPVLASTSVTTCLNSNAVLTVQNPQPNTTYKWYNSANVYIPGQDGISFTATNITAATSYSVEAVNACGQVSAKTTVAISVGTINAPTVVPSSLTVNVNEQATFTASSTTANVVFKWYDGNNVYLVGKDNPVFVTPALSAGTYTYYVEAVSGLCTSTRTSVTLTVKTPGTPVPVPCEFASVQTNGTTGVALLGSILNELQAVDNDAETGSQLLLPVGVGATVWQKLEFAGPASNVGDTVRIRISSPATLLSVGLLSAIDITTFNGAISNNDTKAVNDQFIDLQLLDGGSTAILSFVPTAPFTAVEVKLKGGVVSLFGSIRVHYARRIIATPEIEASTVTICIGNAATLRVTDPQPNVTYKWYDGATYIANKDGVELITDPITTAGTKVYSVRAFRNGCESAGAAINVQVQNGPATPTPVAGNLPAICHNTSTTLQVTAINGITYNWYDAANNKLVVNNNSYVTPVNLAPGTYTYHVEGINTTGCSSAARAAITLRVNRNAGAGDITVSNQSVCTGTNVVLTPATTVASPVFKWYGANNALITTGVSGSGVLTLTGLAAGTYKYYVSVSGTNVCENDAAARKEVQVVVKSVTTIAEITAAPVSICSGNTATLTAVADPAILNPVFTWYSDNTLSQVVATTASFTTTQLTATKSYFVTVSGTNRCAGNASNAREVVVTVSANPLSVSVSPLGTTACLNNTTTLSVENPVANLTYTWYNAANGGMLLFTGSSYTTPALTVPTTYYVGVSNGTCNSSRASVRVDVASPPPVPSLKATGRTVCAGTPATLEIENEKPELIYNWYDANTGGNLMFSGTRYVTNPLTVNPTNFYVSATLINGCSSTSRANVAVTVNAAPDVPSATVNNLDVCEATGFTLNVSAPVSGYTYKWYKTSTLGTAVFTGPSYTVSGGIAISTVYYLEATNATGCNSITRGSVNVNVIPDPGVPTVIASSAAVCPGTSVTLTASSAAPGATFKWYTTATSTTAIGTTDILVTGPITSDTSFYVEVKNASGCTGMARQKTDIAVLRQLAAPEPTVENTTPTSVTFRWPAVPGATGYEVSLDGGTSFSPVAGGASGLVYVVSGLQPNTEVALVARSLGIGSCQTSPLSARTAGRSTNPLGNDIFIPNAFTPNGDGRNDVFLVFGTSIQAVHMTVYNQYGELLFESKDKGRGWDGTGNGKAQPSGVYVYVIKITMQDGSVVTKKGSINIIR